MRRTEFRVIVLCVAALAFSCGGGGGDGDKKSPDVSDDSVAQTDGCQPNCESKQCGDDGCNGSCGTCGVQATCNEGICMPSGCTEGPCDDNDPCTHSDSCDGGVCKGSAYSCDDEKECTDDQCDGKGDCVFEIVPNRCLINGICYESGQLHANNQCKECMPFVSKTAWSADDSNECDDNDECLTGEYCDGGECIPGETQLNCDDDSVCTDDSCDSQIGCVNEFLQGPCDDQDLCTNDDKCQDGQCLGTAVDCNDGNPCTGDTCDQKMGCVYQNSQSDCDDGNPCTVGDYCSEGSCKTGVTPLNCDDSNPCTTDSCKPGEGCVNQNNQDPCDDSDACTAGDKCQDGTCQPGAQAVDCNDGNQCTDDTCDPVAGCANAPNQLPCDDNNQCTLGDVCSGGQCQAGGQLLACDDSDGCTTDSCLPQSGCQHVFNTAPCDDANECTDGDACSLGDCIGQVKICSDGNVCTADTCNPFTPGGCVYSPKTGSCDDGDPCTLSDYCQNGECTPGAQQLPCDDNNACTQDSCVPGAGCKHTSIVAFCDDGDPCTQGDYCANGACVGGGSICACKVDADCAVQEDGNLCNGTLKCENSSPDVSVWKCVVKPGTVVACNPQQDTACKQAQCQPATGQCQPTPINEGGMCDDNNMCTTSSSCVNGTCAGAGSLDCNDGEECTVDSCLTATGCKHTAKSNGTPCGQGSFACQQGKCIPCTCQDKQCGDNGCGQSCGSCNAEWLVCENNQCIEPCPDHSGIWVVPFWWHVDGLCWGQYYATELRVMFLIVERVAGQLHLVLFGLPPGEPSPYDFMSCSFNTAQCRIECECGSSCLVGFYNAYAAYLGEYPWVSGGTAWAHFQLVDGLMEFNAVWNESGSAGSCKVTDTPAVSEFGDKENCEQCSIKTAEDALVCSPGLICAAPSLAQGDFGACVPLCLTDSDCAPGFFCDGYVCWFEDGTDQNVCYNGDVWEQNLCGITYNLLDDCKSGETCLNGQCL